MPYLWAFSKSKCLVQFTAAPIHFLREFILTMWNFFRSPSKKARQPPSEAAPVIRPLEPIRKPAPPRAAPPPPSPLLPALREFAGQGPNPPLQVLQAISEFWLKEKLVARQGLLDALRKVSPRAKQAFLGHLLADENFISEDKLIYTLSSLYRIPCYNIAQYDINPKALASVSGEMARRHQVFPVDCMGRILTLAVTNPFTNLALLEIPKHLTVRKVLCRRDMLQTHLDIYYPPDAAAPLPSAISVPVSVPQPGPPDGELDALFARWRQSTKDATLRPIPSEEIEFHIRGGP